MVLHDTQKIIAKDTHRFRVCCNGRRWGKTTLAIEEIKGKALATHNGRICYIAPTYQQARDIAWEGLKKELMPIIVTVNESRLELKVRNVKGGESLITLRGWESIETLRGQKFHFIVIDEVSSMRAFFEKWDEVLRPTLTDYRGECLFISTPKGYNHFYDLYMKEKNDDDYKSFHFTTKDNPYIPHDEIMKAQHELPENRFAQEYLADFKKTEGLVYKEFNRETCIFDDKSSIINPTDVIAGLDFGYTNPTAVLTITKDYDNTFWVTSEWYKTGRTTEEIIEYCKTLSVNRWYPDPAEPDRIEQLRRGGLNVREVNKDVVKGIDSVRSLLKNGKLKIHSSCENLISEFETYVYKENKPMSNEQEEPVKEHDHALDALRYALFMQNSTYTDKKNVNQYIPKGLNAQVMQTKWLDKSF